MFSGGDRVAIRRVHYHDAALGCSGHVDVVNTNAGATNYAQSSGVVHQVAGDFGFTADHETGAAVECFAQFIGFQSDALFDDEPSVAQWLQAGIADVVSYKNPWSSCHEGFRFGLFQ